jgi:hypothetical protein
VRGKIIFLVILAMLVALVYFVGSRTRDPHVMPKARTDEAAEGGLLDAASAASSSEGGAAQAGGSGSAVAPVAPLASGADASTPLLDRPLRVVAPSWDLAAALHVANGGRTTADGSAVKAARLEVTIDVAGGPRDVENRLARGGGDAEGADVAVLPLPAFVAAYERIRALEPQVVHVVGWSHGREVLLGAKDGMLAKPAPAGDVAVASDDPAATALALFALDEAGTAPARVRVAPDPRGATLAALVRPLPSDRPPDAPAKVLFTTADASRFVPFVAVAARGFVDGHTDAVAALLRAWIDGATALRKDVPAAARRIAGEPGALEPAAMLERLAWISDPGPGDEAFALGSQGSDAVTVQWLFARDWRLLREAGSLTSPAPSGAVVATGPFGRAFAAPPARPSPPAVETPDPAARVLLSRRFVKGDAEAVATEIAALASIFERSPVRVTARPASLARDAADFASDHRGIKSERLVVSPSPPADASVALIEVLAAP